MKLHKQTWLLISIIICAAACCAIVAASPYGRHMGFGYRLIECHVVIQAPPDSVYAYPGDSKNAGKWSVFVHHAAECR